MQLLERGVRVTLLDAWGPGNSRSSSGGETRIMRGTYGPDQPYTETAARALKLWAKYERRWKKQFLHRTGVLWMVSSRDDAYERGSLDVLRQARMKFQELSTPEMKKRWPQINFEGVHWGIFEPECGYLDARASCQAVVDAFVSEGGTYRQLAVSPDGLEGGSLRSLALSDGSRLRADYYVFACGPWLGKLFPETLGSVIRPTKQDIFFFGTPAGDSRFTDEHLPVWGDHGERFFYGIPGQRPPRIQGGRRYAWWRFRSYERGARGQSSNAEPRSRIYRLPLSRDERRAADRDPRLPVRADAQQQLHRGSPSSNGECLAAGRRLGPRLQTRSGAGRDDGRVDFERWRAGCRLAAFVIG